MPMCMYVASLYSILDTAQRHALFELHSLQHATLVKCLYLDICKLLVRLVDA